MSKDVKIDKIWNLMMNRGLKKLILIFLIYWTEYPMATGYADGDGVSEQTRAETTENLWEFYNFT